MPKQFRLPKEIRFAVVMYGGVSLAIYINGATQELMSMVRATARKNHDPNSDYHLELDELTEVEQVYRCLGERLGARFVVDILAGTSAGGINAVYLAKALANDQKIDKLRKLWIDEGDIERLVNDQKSLDNLTNQRLADSPTSLLNSQRMYYHLLKALQDMEGDDPSADDKFSPYVDELDLFITATDLQGLSVPIRSARREVARERRYRNVFQFRYSTTYAAGSADPKAKDDADPDEKGKPINEFLRKYDPFLAFAARCTSSFPFAFEPMRLEDVSKIVGRSPFREYAYIPGEWWGFYKDYTVETFPSQPFGDGGYLDNKPFSYATATLSRRRADLPVDRKLVYIEPAPEEIDQNPIRALGSPDAFENVLLALTKLPRYETIREDLDAVNRRNRVIQDVNIVLRNIESIYTAEEKKGDEGQELASRDTEQAQLEKPKWRDSYLNEMIKTYGAGYIPYHELRVQEVLDNLSLMLARGMGWAEDSPQTADLRVLLHEWRKAYYTNAMEPKTKRGRKRKPENDLLFRLDTGWYIRRLHYLRSMLDTLLKDLGENRLGTDGSPSKSILDHSKANWSVRDANRMEYHDALLLVKKQLNESFARLRGRGRAMRARNLVSMASIPGSPFDNYRAELQKLKEFLEVQRPVVNETTMPQAAEGAARTQVSEEKATQLDLLVQFTVRKARDPKLPAPSEYQQALDQLEATTAALTQDTPKGLIHAALYETSDLIQIAIGRKPLAQGLKKVSLGSGESLQHVQEFVAFYDDRFEVFDMLTFPISYGTDVGESDEVEIIRISPLDATLVKGRDYDGRRKLAGTKLGNFGAFFSRDWRENDMVWGRLDAVECLIKAVWPEGEKTDERDEFIETAHKIIIAQFMKERTHSTLLNAAQKTRRKISDQELNEAIDRWFDDNEEEQIRFFREDYEPDPDFPAESTLNAAARSTTVLGKLMEGLSFKYSSITEPAGILARIGRVLFFILSLADSGTLPAQILKRIAVVAILVGLIVMTIGSILTRWNLTLGAGFSRAGAQLVVITLALRLLQITADRFRNNWPNLKDIGPKIKAIAWVVFATLAVVFLLLLFLASSWGILDVDWNFPTGGFRGWLDFLRQSFIR